MGLGLVGFRACRAYVGFCSACRVWGLMELRLIGLIVGLIVGLLGFIGFSV